MTKITPDRMTIKIVGTKLHIEVHDDDDIIAMAFMSGFQAGALEGEAEQRAALEKTNALMDECTERFGEEKTRAGFEDCKRVLAKQMLAQVIKEMK